MNQNFMIFLFEGKQLLELADKLDPGLSKWRGELLFDLQSTSVLLAQRALEENRITAQQAKVIN